MTDRPRVAVVGVGNPMMGDDAVGKRVVDALHELALPDDVDVTHAGTTAFLALEALSGAERGVVVDAVADGEADPGTLHRYRLVDGTFEGDAPDVFMHDFSFTEAVRSGAEAYDLPADVLVLGVEPADTTVGLELSDRVAERLPAVVEAVLAEVTGGETPSTDVAQAVQTSGRANDIQQTTETGE